MAEKEVDTEKVRGSHRWWGKKTNFDKIVVVFVAPYIIIWAGYLISLNFNYVMCGMEINIFPTGLFWELSGSFS